MTTGYEDFRTAQQLDDSTRSQSAIPFWGDDPDAWDTIFFAGEAAPGLAKVTGEVKNRVDKKMLPGTNGAKMTHIGYEPAEVDVELRLWMPEQLKAFADLVKQLRPRRNSPPPVTVNHPALALYEIRSAQMLSIGLPEYDDHADCYRVKMKLREYVTSGNQKSKVKTANYDLTTIPHAINVGTGAAQQAKPSEANAAAVFPEE